MVLKQSMSSDVAGVDFAQGTRLIGVCDSQVAFEQSQVLLVWTRLIMPNGRSIVLKRQQGADAGGYSGLEDEIDNHWKEFLGAAALSTLPGVGAELGSVRTPEPIRTLFRRCVWGQPIR